MSSGNGKIDRKALVSRHNPVYTRPELGAPLSVGNGTFCFTADFTGLQTFSDAYAALSAAFPLATMSDWGWHSYPDAPVPKSAGDTCGLRLTPFETFGRQVDYATDDKGQEALFKAVRQNAHRFHLGKLGFDLPPEQFEKITDVRQTLSLWDGVLASVFTVDGERVSVETFVHPDEDAIYVRAVSPLIKNGTLRITLSFPYGSHKKTGADWTAPHLHKTHTIEETTKRIVCLHTMDKTEYTVAVSYGTSAKAVFDGVHTVTLTGVTDTLELCVHFAPVTGDNVRFFYSGFDEAKKTCSEFWERYWTTGGAIDFSGSTDSRANELERRVVLSQYLTAIQSRGSIPPAETGLTFNSWYGKFHMEMHYWHTAHFALWGRVDELKKSMEYYHRILPVAREIAASQGYKGARWPKMCDPSGYNTPSSIGVLLLWQQPHPIMLSELCYRAAPDDEFLKAYREVIVESAEFMCSFVHLDGDGSRYVLGAPYIPAQERHDPNIVLNAAYEVEYFRWALKQANVWLTRLGEKPRADFAEVAEKLAAPAVKDGVYLAHENCPNTFTELPFYTDHPSMLAMYGVLNGEGVDPAVMSATLDKVLEVWDMQSLWGWDFPVLAMTACRLGRAEDAVRLLLLNSPKNTYLPNGHNMQVGSDDLPIYLPGNAGLLLAVAMMAAGYDGKTGSSFPKGFTVKAEGIAPYV